MGSNGTNGQALPEPDAVTGLNPSGATGTLVLADQAIALSLPAGAVTTGTPGVVDLLGYGTSNTFETAVATAGTANSVPDALTRHGTIDTDSNAADFTVTSSVTPENAAGETTQPTDPTDPTDPPDPGTPAEQVTIAQLQGSGDASRTRASPSAPTASSRRSTPRVGSTATRSRPPAPVGRST
ncbi:hypothetical protein P9139_01475 [Curtobacterium flaccumfaciens]|nr:hypothetical protein P9139_01475 [Curtobacterium flaccumfaciens]